MQGQHCPTSQLKLAAQITTVGQWTDIFEVVFWNNRYVTNVFIRKPWVQSWWRYASVWHMFVKLQEICAGRLKKNSIHIESNSYFLDLLSKFCYNSLYIGTAKWSIFSFSTAIFCVATSNLCSSLWTLSRIFLYVCHVFQLIMLYQLIFQLFKRSDYRIQHYTNAILKLLRNESKITTRLYLAPNLGWSCQNFVANLIVIKQDD